MHRLGKNNNGFYEISLESGRIMEEFQQGVWENALKYWSRSIKPKKKI